MDKARGAVGCAHCQQLGAETTCARCGGLICRPCAADPRRGRCPTSPLPTTRLAAVEGGLIAVCPRGRRGLFARGAAGELVAIDLAGDGVQHMLGERLAPGPPPLLTERRAVIPVFDRAGNQLVVHDFEGFGGQLAPLPPPAPPVTALAAAGELALVARADGHVTLLDLARDEPRWRVQLDQAADQLALASGGEPAAMVCGTRLLWREASDAPPAERTLPAPAIWAAFAGAELALISADGQLSLQRADGSAARFSLGEQVERELAYATSWRRCAAACADDGSWLATRRGLREILLWPLSRGRPSPLRLAQNSAPVTLLSAVGRAPRQQLLAADTLGRVLRWDLRFASWS